MTMLNDVRETIGAALKYLGYSYNSRSGQELAEARDLLISWKRNLAKFENDQYKNGLVSGEFPYVRVTRGISFRFRKSGMIFALLYQERALPSPLIIW